METNPDLELVNIALRRLLEEKGKTHLQLPAQEASDIDIVDVDEDNLLLSKLLSQVESLRQDGPFKGPEASKGTEDVVDVIDEKTDNAEKDNGDASKLETGTEEIVKELRKVKRQNTITHWLLSIMVVLTLTWQLSEVSLILKVKDGLSHPFKSLGSMFTGFFKDKADAVVNGGDADKEASSTNHKQSEALHTPSFKTPELPHLDVPNLA